MAELRQLWQKRGTSVSDCSKIRRNAVITRNALLGKNVEDFLKTQQKVCDSLSVFCFSEQKCGKWYQKPA